MHAAEVFKYSEPYALPLSQADVRLRETREECPFKFEYRLRRLTARPIARRFDP